MLNVMMMRAIMLNVIMLSVIMLSVIILNVVAPLPLLIQTKCPHAECHVPNLLFVMQCSLMRNVSIPSVIMPNVVYTKCRGALIKRGNKKGIQTWVEFC